MNGTRPFLPLDWRFFRSLAVNRAVRMSLLCWLLSASASPATVSVVFSNDIPHNSGADNNAEVLTFDFFVDGSGNVTLDASTSATTPAAVSAVNQWDGSAGTVSYPGAFNTAFRATIREGHGGSLKLSNFGGAGGLGIAGQNAYRIDRPTLESIVAGASISGARIHLQNVSWISRSNSTVDMELRVPGAAYTRGNLPSQDGTWDLAPDNVYLSDGSSLSFSSAPNVTGYAVNDGYTLSGFEFDVVAPATPTGFFFGPAPLTIVDIDLNSTSGECRISWEAALNQQFAVQRSGDLSNWTTLATNHPPGGADGATASHADPSPPPDRAFYQVKRPIDPAEKPNVLLLVVDDLRDHEEFSGNNTVLMPNLDRLAARSIKFTNAYCQVSFCNPSRTSFLTGLRPDTTGITNNTDFFRDSADPVVANAVTLPQLFRANGYYSVSLGKILHGGQLDPLSWDVQTNSFPATPAGNSGTWVNMTSDAETPLTWCRWRAPECADDDLGDGIMANQAISILGEKRDDPFFLAVGFKKPHDPFVAPKRYFDMYPLAGLALHADPPDATPAPPQAVPSNASKRAFDSMDDNDRLEFLRCYAACSTYVDAQIGRVLDAMDTLGLWQNTIVLLWTDHGYHQGERGWWNKTLLYERDAKVPLMAAVPQMPVSNVDCAGVIELVDIYPTLARLAGIDFPANLEGESFLPLIEDPTRTWHGTGITQKNTGRTVRNGRFRYTEWTDGEKELYDHDADPGEWHNLASDPAYTSVMEALGLYLE